jgi:DNA-binding XRE family transcriptional regulator
MTIQTIDLAGKSYVLVPMNEFVELQQRATGETGLPDLPAPDRDGNVPAVAYARASLARKLILSRRAAGLTQVELAKRSGVRVETVSRLELGKQSAAPATVERIERALRRAASSRKKLAR